MANAGLPLYTAAECRELDRIAIEDFGMPGILLMKRAGQALFERLLAVLPEEGNIAVMCGTGNNGGDGFIVAGLAAQQGIAVQCWLVGDEAKISGDAARARDFARQAEVLIAPFSEAALSADIIVDALLGTGLSGTVRPNFAQAIAAINDAADRGSVVIAADIPSGLCSDSGKSLGAVVKADATVTFIGVKRGLLTGIAADVVGELDYADLAVPAQVFEQLAASSFQFEYQPLPSRKATAHKGDNGHVLLIGGNHGMAGAILLSAKAALRGGAGLVSCASRAEHVSALIANQPELMSRGVSGAQALAEMLDKATVIAIGPGLAQDAWARELLAALADCDKPQVWDADALNLLAESPAIMPQRIITPHPGEAARLLGISNAEVQQDRFATARQLQQQYGGIVLLKGSGTVIADEHNFYVNSTGSPAMASGGMGDVLTGLIAALLAQGFDPLTATCQSACIHGLAAEQAAEQGERGCVASDLLPFIQQKVSGL